MPSTSDPAIGSFSQEHRTNPQSLTATWKDAVLATRVSSADGTPVTDASTLNDSLRYIIDVSQIGTAVMFRLKYPSNLSVTTPPQICVFGCDTAPSTFTNVPLQPLRSAGGNYAEALSVSVRDTAATIDGTAWKWTIPDPTVHVWDRLANPFIVVSVAVAVAGTTGDPELCTIEYKPV